MKTTIQKIALGVTVAVLAGPLVTSISASAGDYNGGYVGGGVKDMRGAYTPVPAPAPIPEYSARWYLRADVGVGFGLGMDASERGMTYGNDEGGAGYNAAALFGMGENGSIRSNSNEEIGYIFGAGIGYYFSPKFRMDITGEVRMEKQNTINGDFQYFDVGTPTDRVNGDFQDSTKLRSTIFMANGYYDMNRHGRWNPYVGAGLGFAVNELQRTHTTNLNVCDTRGDPTCSTPNSITGYNASTNKDYTFSLAASAMAGVTYRISKVTSLDFNYRYLYVGGTDTSATINGYNSTINVAAQHEHYLRAGLRWDIN
jgi:opacity protein-like surface antigen